MSGLARRFARQDMDRGKKRRDAKLLRGAHLAGEAARRQHLAAIEPIAPAGVAQPGARRKAS